MLNYRKFDIKKLERFRQVVDRIAAAKDTLLEVPRMSSRKKSRLLKEAEEWNTTQFIIRHIMRKMPKVA